MHWLDQWLPAPRSSGLWSKPVKWQTDRAVFFRRERQAIRKTFPDAELVEVNGLVVLRGDFPVHDENGSEIDRYKLDIIFPTNYPDRVPIVLVMDKRIPASVQRHVFPKDRTACLCLPHEVSLHLPEIDFMGFWGNLLKFWLVGQASYDRTGKWPFPERAHDHSAIYDGFSELLGISDRNAAQRFTSLLLRKTPAKGHELCPCGSGLKLRACHQSEYQSVRSLLTPDILKSYRKHLL